MLRSLLGKYKEIVAAIAVFLILDAGVLLLNFYTSYQIADDARAMHLANRQSMLTQRIFYSVEQIHDDLQAGRNIEDSQRKLSVSYKQFDEVLDAFIYGGSLIGEGQGQDSLLLDDSYQELSDQYLTLAEKVWRPYRSLVSDLVYADYSESFERDKLIKKSLRAIDYSREYGDGLLSAVSEFAIAVEASAHKKTVSLRVVQGVAIFLAVINFFIILFHFLKRLNLSDQKFKRSQGELLEIMRTVRDGLFLLTPEYKVGSQYSASMNDLFRQKDFSNVNFFELLSLLVSSEDLSVAKDYVDSLFNPRVKTSLMDVLNPLKEVRLNITNKYGSSDHFFEFHFSRVYEEKEIIHLLVSVKDVTENVGLRKKLNSRSLQVDQDMESVMSLMSVDFELLKEFVPVLESGVKSINESLEKRVYSSSLFVAKLDKIHRVVHSLKGEASMLGLTMLEKNIHVLEDKLSILKNKKVLEGDDFLAITVELTAIEKMSVAIGLFVTRFLGATSPKTDDRNDGGVVALSVGLKKLVDKISCDNDKSVKLDLSRFDIAIVPEKHLNELKHIVIQLLRNAVVHGLESPDERVKRGKPEQGCVSVVAEKSNTSVVVTIKDDGRGIDFPSIRKYLISQKMYTDKQVGEMNSKDLVKVIFTPGYSTTKKVDKHSGRGVGLDVVKTYVDNMGASLTLGCKANRSSEFRIAIPLHNIESSVLPAQCA